MKDGRPNQDFVKQTFCCIGLKWKSQWLKTRHQNIYLHAYRILSPLWLQYCGIKLIVTDRDPRNYKHETRNYRY